MKTVNLQVTLPDDLAQKAQDAGLLTSEALRSLLTTEIERRGLGASARRPLSQLIGAGKRQFGSVEEVDRFIQSERDSWES